MPTFLENGSQVVDQALIDNVVRRIVERFHPNRIVLFGRLVAMRDRTATSTSSSRWNRIYGRSIAM